ncbi:MAG: TauD/TfdA family dioxygenase [Planctomycetota bacterium]
MCTIDCTVTSDRFETFEFDESSVMERSPIDDFATDELHARLANFGVIAFRDQFLDDAVLISLMKRLGTITFTQGERSVSGFPDLNLVSNVGKANPKSVFHSDTSYVKETPAYTFLRPVELPERGGATLFTNQYLAWDRLPIRYQVQLAGVQALHRVTGLDESTLDEVESWHPLARRHPRSDRTALYLTTPKRCLRLRDVDGKPVPGSERMIRMLYRHSIQKNRIYRHHWQPGDLVIWDNRCTMHRGEHEGVIGDRIFHRGMVIDVATSSSTV